MGWTSDPLNALSGPPSDSEGQSSPPDRSQPYPPLPVGTGKIAAPVEIRDGKGRFLPGNSGGGRPKGSRSKLKDAVLSAVLEHYNTNGKKILENLALFDPGTYMRIILQLLPPDNMPRDDLGDLTKEELDEILAGIYRARQVRELVNFVEGRPND